MVALLAPKPSQSCPEQENFKKSVSWRAVKVGTCTFWTGNLFMTYDLLHFRLGIKLQLLTQLFPKDNKNGPFFAKRKLDDENLT